MIHETIEIKAEGSAEYARLSTYLWDDSKEIPISNRALVLICPGGGYHRTTDREAEAIALRLMSMGHHAAVLRYSVAPVCFPVALRELAQCVAIFRRKAEEWHIDAERIVIMGFSAGGHLAASYGVYWNNPEFAKLSGCESELLRPNALILGYPVITADPKYRHERSIRNLLGSNWQNNELQDRVSLEKHVGFQTPKTFIWSTFTDDNVPAENSLLWVQAMMQHKIPVEYHMYEKGGHGLSLASELTDNQEHTCIQEECQSWVDLAETWLRNLVK